MSTATKEQKHDEYLRHKDAYKARARAWALANPDKRKQISNRDNKKRSELKKQWHQQKRYGAVIDRDECVRCGSMVKLLIHHNDGNNGKMGKPLNNNLTNLVVLCKSCHPKVHYRGVIKEFVL